MTAPTALWRGIAETLLAEIAGGAWPPGARLPSEAGLAARFGVNRHTVRRALADLAQTGHVRARRGAGVYVEAAPPPDYPIGARVRFHQTLRAAGRLPEKRVLALSARGATMAEAAALRLSRGDAVLAYDGLSLADAQPLAVFCSVFPGRLTGMAAALRHDPSVTAALRACGVADYTRATTRLGAVAADAVQAGHLHLRSGDPLMHSVGVNVGPDGAPVEYGQSWFAGGRITLLIGAEG